MKITGSEVCKQNFNLLHSLFFVIRSSFFVLRSSIFILLSLFFVSFYFADQFAFWRSLHSGFKVFDFVGYFEYCILLEMKFPHPSARSTIKSSQKDEQNVIVKARSLFPSVYFELNHLCHFHCAKFFRRKNFSCNLSS